VKNEYDKVGRERLEWYDLSYWIKKLGLDVSPNEVLHDFEDRIRIFPEVPEILEKLRYSGFRLIIITNARREFADLELERTGIVRFFYRVFSSTSDFELVKNTVEVYEKVCDICEVSPHEMVHVGDDRCFDFDVPKRLGIVAFYVDRKGQCKEECVIHSLQELNEKLVALG
jgi:putative hydrolase of the HAD superfamily